MILIVGWGVEAMHVGEIHIVQGDHFLCMFHHTNRGDPMWVDGDFYKSDEDCPPLDLDQIFDGREVPEQLIRGFKALLGLK